MNFAPRRRSLADQVIAGVVGVAIAGLLAGCGNSYRATIGTNNPVPVPTQPLYLPVVLSTAGPSAQGLATLIDLAGDTISVLVNTGIQPVSLALSNGGGVAYAVNLGAPSNSGVYDGSVSSFTVTTTLRSANVNTTSLNGSGGVFNPPAVTTNPCTTGTPEPAVFDNASLIFVSETVPSPAGGNYVLPLSRNVSGTGVPAVLPVVQTDGVVTNFTGLVTGTRAFAIERDQNEVQVIDDSASATTPLVTASLKQGFSMPTSGVASPNGHRVFILNCNATVTAVDAQANTVLSQISIPVATGQATAGIPVAGDYFNGGNLLVTANTTGADTQGSVSIINASESAQAFSSVLGTAVVGNNPVGVGVLQDGTRAYVVNEGDAIATVSAGGPACDCKSVSVVSLTSFTTVKTIPLYYHDSATTAACPASTTSATGQPMQIIASPDVTDQKVYVLCDQPSADGTYYVFAVRTYAVANGLGQSTDADIVSAAIQIQGVPTQIKITPAR